MKLFKAGKLDPEVFDEAVRRGTNDLGDLLALAAQTHSPQVESTHFLMALGRVAGGHTQKGLARRGLTPEQWLAGLASCAAGSPTAAAPVALTATALDESGQGTLYGARDRCGRANLERISEALLLLCALERATPAVKELCSAAGIDLGPWCAELEDVIAPPPALNVFAAEPPGTVLPEAFSPGGRRILRLLQSETEALGYEQADLRHLLLALLAWENGATHYGLHHQGRLPRKVQEAVLLSLKARARRQRSSVPLDREHLQPLLQRVLEQAGTFAGRGRAARVAEPHLLRAFLEADSTARHLLTDQAVDVAALQRLAEEFDPAAEEQDGGDVTVADVETVRQRLRERLVGQERAIEQIMPYVEFLRFGMRTPGHPVGVFLFCGQSGSGKTELAKGLAQAVYGSEDNLIFLEMGQFNAPESMNIFVGAPHGYIGFGEGKLTNGLRDRPRAVVLFDEVEKAHARVLDALLRFLDEGKIDDPAGPVRDGTQCIVVLTSNAASDELDELWRKCEGQPNWRTLVRKELRERLRRYRFRVEFLNRVDEVILFNALKPSDYVEIARRHVETHRQRLRDEYRVDLLTDDRAAEVIGAHCTALNEGARAVSRLVRALVLLPVCRFVLGRQLTPPVRVRLQVVPGKDPASEPTAEVKLA